MAELPSERHVTAQVCGWAEAGIPEGPVAARWLEGPADDPQVLPVGWRGIHAGGTGWAEGVEGCRWRL